MKRNVLVALLVGLVVLGGGYFAVLRPQTDAMAALSKQIANAQQRISDDQVQAQQYAARSKKERPKIALLSSMEIVGTDGDVERQFLSGLNDLVRQNHIGMRPLSLSAAFTVITPSSAPAPGPSASPVVGPPGGATPAPSSGPVDPGQALAITGAPQLFKNDGTLEFVGSWPNVLRSISDLSRMPVLLEVTSITVSREKVEGGSNPLLDARIGFTLYRGEQIQ